MPAERHLPTASGTAARGGSIMDIRPTKQRLSVWKLTSSVSKAKPLGYLSSGRNRWQKPGGMKDKGEQMNFTNRMMLNKRNKFKHYHCYPICYHPYPVLALPVLPVPDKRSGKPLSSHRPWAAPCPAPWWWSSGQGSSPGLPSSPAGSGCHFHPHPRELRASGIIF